mmetsp:Transcript_8290/g.17263  ORF Transcript_8290/g.17263 Transcript_8290/m.17263 type:complete len:599 (+) Transcript_8290:81-1877(+)
MIMTTETESSTAPMNDGVGAGSSSAASPGPLGNVLIMADTFPAKAHLLLTHLTESNPEIATFSPDGKSFRVFDQTTFAQKQLPQYFKHSNWGSFVRQLNLYGFTSVRDKEGVEGVWWSHELFLRDRTDLLDKIKRTKKKTATPKASASSNGSVAVNTNANTHSNGTSGNVSVSRSRVQSPLSDGGISSGVNSLDEPIPVFASHSESLSRYISSSTNMTMDQDWMAAEFAHLKQQNFMLEQKLNLLLKITLKMSKGGVEDVYSRGKRRRANEEYSSSSGAHENFDLSPIHEDQKMISDQESAEDSFKMFIDNMFTGDGPDQSRGDPNMVPLDCSDRDTDYDNSQSSHGNMAAYNSPLGNNGNIPYPGISTQNTDYNMMEEYGNFPNSGDWTTMANANMEKAYPDAVAVIASDCPDVVKDMEAGNSATVGVAVVPAQAVEDQATSINDNISLHVIENDGGDPPRTHSDSAPSTKKYLSLILKILAGVAVAVAVIVPSVIAVQRKDQPIQSSSSNTLSQTGVTETTPSITSNNPNGDRPLPLPSDNEGSGNDFFGENDRRINSTGDVLFSSADVVRGIGVQQDWETVTFQFSGNHCSCHQG